MIPENLFVHVWDLPGYVRLNEDFRALYEKKAKEYGITKLLQRLEVCYQTVADIYRRNKLVEINFLEKISKILQINKRFIESSITEFSEGLRNRYKLSFPLKISPLTLRGACMIIGDGHGSLYEHCSWSQKSKNISWGVNLMSNILNYVPTIWDSNSSCKTFTVPRVLLKAIYVALDLKKRTIKSYELFKKVCELPKDYRFQVFAQLVVDEGCPNYSFVISQKDEEVREGIYELVKSLDYPASKVKNGIYLSTESFPKIKEDLSEAKKKFGRLGGFWFKDKRFLTTCENTNLNYFKKIRKYDERFDRKIEKLKSKKKIIFRLRELRMLTDMQVDSILRRIDRLLNEGVLIRISKGVYCFPEKVSEETLEWLALDREEKILRLVSSREIINSEKLFKLSGMSDSEFYRVIKKLINEGKINRVKRGLYSIS
ncbi:MAG: hypothetical protein PVG65_06285 [Candidatus Thorarchaeota archaeon]|jgi:hypothetical protein